MYEKKITIESDAGVHARPAMMLVREAMIYANCEIQLIKDDVEADCKSIMSVLGLAIISGSNITIRADGEKEEEAVNKLYDLIENNFK